MEDPAVLWNPGLRSILRRKQLENLRRRVREMLHDVPALLRRLSRQYSDWSNADPEVAAEPLLSLAAHLPKEFPGDDFVASSGASLEHLVWEWVAEHQTEEPEKRSQPATIKVPSWLSHPEESRSIFDDLLEGR